MNITIYDIAKEANVSMATVSRVVNGNPNVKPATRKKVNEVIERLGYRPNAVARGLASKKTTTVGVIIPDISNPIYAEMTRGIEDIATMYKYNIILSNSDLNPHKEVQLINTMLSKQVDGIIFMGANVTDTIACEFQKINVPIVLAGTVEKTETIPSVNIDYFEATYNAINYFIKNGHKNIGIIIGNRQELMNGDLYLGGYKKALEEANIEFKEEYIIEGDYSYESGMEAYEQFSQLENKPTAIYCIADQVAIGVIHGAQDRQVNVPNEIEVISSDNTPQALMVRPQLTTIDQPLYDIGAVSMRLLTKLMNNEDVEDKIILLPHRLEVRDSTK